MVEAPPSTSPPPKRPPRKPLTPDQKRARNVAAKDRRKRKKGGGAVPPGYEGEVGAKRAREQAAAARALEAAPTVELEGVGLVTLDASFFREALKGSYEAVGELTDKHDDPSKLRGRNIWTITDGEASVGGTCLAEIVKHEGEAVSRAVPWVVLAVVLGGGVLARVWQTYQLMAYKRAVKVGAAGDERKRPSLPGPGPGQAA